MNTALLVAYDGTDFCGWQVQANGRTVQGELERAIEAAFGSFSRVTGSGRTDAGVHAAGQVCNFALADGIKISPARVADALNAKLPPDVRVLESAAAPEEFDACSVEVSPWADKFGGRTPGVYIDVCGSGFLYNMVRIMAGAILECGTGKLPLAAAEEALRTGDRELLGKTMPAKGLTLLRAEYGFPLFGRAERE